MNWFKKLIINGDEFLPKDSGAVRYDASMSLTDSQKEVARNNIGAGTGGGGGEQEVFWATYDTTTSAEIEEAYQAGKICMCLGSGYGIFVLSRRESATKHQFAAPINTQIFTVICENNVWSTANRSVITISSVNPQPLGTAASGSSNSASRADHVHENNIYVATYGTTTSAQLEAAYQAGKIILAEYDDRIYISESRESATRFILSSSTRTTIFNMVCDTDAWSIVYRSIPTAYSSTPAALGTASAGGSSSWSRGDHVHAMPSATDVGAIASPANPSDGQFLVYDSTAGAWTAQTVPSANGVNF